MATYTFDRISDPKLIIVDAPATSITVQELYDVIRDYEDEPANMDLPRIVSGGGKEQLGGGVSVGITITLYDWYVQFEARGGPGYTLCEIAGGNLVGYDTTLEQYYVPISPSAFTTVVRTSSSSATLVEQEALQFASFQNGVWIDTTNGAAGIDYPLGTREYPVNNLVDAQTIAASRGFNTLCVLGDITFEDPDDLNGYMVHGENSEITTITLVDCSTNKTTFMYATVEGTLTGTSIFIECHLGNLVGVSSHAHQCVVKGNLTLSGDTQLLNCYSGVPGSGTPVIDMGGSGNTFEARAYTGGLKIINKSGAEGVSLDFISGQIILDSTVIAGDFQIRGIAKLTDNSTGGSITTNLASTTIEMADAAGIIGENIKWSGMTHDANSNLTAATITQYTDKTLTVVRKQWVLAATYDDDSQLVTYELKEV